MLEERGFLRKQARVHVRSGKAWIGLRLKTHDELVAGLGADAEPAKYMQVPAGNPKRIPATTTSKAACEIRAVGLIATSVPDMRHLPKVTKCCVGGVYGWSSGEIVAVPT